MYFDFSGYSEMALGLARFFGIKLPVNFNSPLKATSIVDYWLRWQSDADAVSDGLHLQSADPAVSRAPGWRREGRRRDVRDMSVAAFVRLIAVPTMVTMFISGVWHGAGYTFIIFGLMHGDLHHHQPRVAPDPAS